MSLYESPSIVRNTMTALCSGVKSLIALVSFSQKLLVMKIGKRIPRRFALRFQQAVHRLTEVQWISF